MSSGFLLSLVSHKQMSEILFAAIPFLLVLLVLEMTIIVSELGCAIFHSLIPSLKIAIQCFPDYMVDLCPIPNCIGVDHFIMHTISRCRAAIP